MVRSEFNFDVWFVIYNVKIQPMLHVADIINFVFFCMHALQPPDVQRQDGFLSLKRHTRVPEKEGPHVRLAY
jgi:hypothetical protein